VWQNIGTAATRVSPRFIWRRWGSLDIGEDAAYRLSLAAELIEAGVAPRELARELGLSPVQFDVSKYDENQPRMPAGSGRECGQWTLSTKTRTLPKIALTHD